VLFPDVLKLAIPNMTRKPYFFNSGEIKQSQKLKALLEVCHIDTQAGQLTPSQ
jgi:hypothetical protein